MAYQLKGIAGQNYGQLTPEEQARVQAAGDAHIAKVRSTLQPTWSQAHTAELLSGAERDAQEIAQRAAEGIFTAKSDAMRLAERARETGQVTIGDANTIPNLQAQGQKALQGAVPTGSAADVLQKGLASGAVSSTDPTAQFNASLQGNNVNAPGITPIAPTITSSQGKPPLDLAQSIDDAKNEAAVQAGTMIKVPIGTGFGYVPTGSAAAQQIAGQQAGTVSPTNPTQQFQAGMQGNTATQPSITPIAPTITSSLPGTFSERMNLAGQAGITNYTGSPQQDAQIQAFQAKQGSTATSAGTTSTGQNLAIKGTLQQGSSDVSVGNLQKTLNELSQAGLVVDNNFGPKTKQAVMAFQQANGLVADGVVGPKTLAKIQELQGQKTQQQNTVQNAVGNTLAQSGIQTDTLEQKFATNPTQTVQDIVNSLSQTSGLSQLNTQITELTKQKQELANRKNEELNSITNNPWISEGLKQKKISSLDAKYQGLESNINDSLSIAQDQQRQGLEQVKYITTTALNQYDKNKPEPVKTQVVEADGKQYLINSQTGERIATIGVSKTTGEGGSTGAGGSITLPDGTVINNELLSAQDKITSINDLLEHAGLNVSVGPSWLGRTTPLKADVMTGDKADFIAGIQQLVSKDTLDTLIRLKQAGGTLGALSDQERIMLQSAATKIGTWALRDKEGNVTAYNASEKSFKKELDTIKHLTERAYLKAGGNAEDIGLTITNDGHVWSENNDGTLTQIL